jgi:Beta-lactamase enzyme family
MQKIVALLFTFTFGTAMAQNKNIQKIEDDFLEKLLLNNPSLASVLANKDSNRVQIVYTQINRDATNKPSFKRYTYNLNHGIYFYPASTAKMPTAFVALQKLNELHKKGLNKNTNMFTDSAFKNQDIVHADTSSLNGYASIANYIKKVFMVSDNEANNRLYEFVGQEYLNNSLYKLGYTDAQIIHRLGVALSEEENRKTNPIRFLDANGKLIFEQPLQTSTLNYAKRNDFVGKGFYKNNVLLNEPFNFSTKNRLYVDDMTDMLLGVLFPEDYNAKKHFNLTKSDYDFLYKYMSKLPTESTHPSFDSTENYDAYCKFLMYGSEKDAIIPKHIRIFNKIGVAYGFTTDIAYIVDFKNDIEFALSATILSNADGIFNDDKYEYETVGWPFLKNLGNEIYNYELKRERKFKPNLKRFKIDYSK